MVNNITLTASMRSNLLSLKNIAAQMDKTQQRLSTGQKVNSAIDNASSYYQARSLTNRAADLMELLNGMDQGIQTIEAATKGLESGAAFLEQATAVATQALTTAKIPAKEWFAAQVGDNGAVVSTAQELRDAVTAGKETICVYGKIDLGDISTSGGIILKNNQKLVGIGYFGIPDSDTDKFSALTASSTAVNNVVNVRGNNILVSDLSIVYSNSRLSHNFNAIEIRENANAVLRDLDIVTEFSDQIVGGNARAGIHVTYGATVDIEGKMNIKVSGRLGFGIYAYNNAVCNIKDNADVKIQCSKEVAIAVYVQSVCNIGGKVQIKTPGRGIFNSYIEKGDGNRVNILSNAEILFDSTETALQNGASVYGRANILDIAAGAKLAFRKDGVTKWYKVRDHYYDENNSTETHSINFDNVESKLPVVKSGVWLQEEIKKPEKQPDTKEYTKILSEYDKLVGDSSYQGVNLLTGGQREIIFNETREHKFTIAGQDMRTAALGLTTTDWQTQGDIAQSLKEISAALGQIRSFQSELGTNYGVIQTRQNFTEALGDVLETGADMLVLADMNEESANYLALQTRQQLAVNSLSLAAQSAQSVLSVF